MSDTKVQTAFDAEVAGTSVAPGANISNTADGILVGVDSPVTTQAVPVGTWQQTQTNAPVGKSYTEEDLARVRQQEKDKLYPQIDSLKEDLSLLKSERDARLADEEAKRLQAEEDAKRKAESEMDLRSLLEQKEAEWQARFEAEKSEREAAMALLEREKQYQALVDYRGHRLAEEQDSIMPELLDLVEGSSQDEIEQSIQNLKDRTARILESVQAASQSARRDMRGASVTAPTVGPMDTNLENQSYNAEQIAGMSFNDYVKNRSRLLGTDNQSNRGMFQ